MIHPAIYIIALLIVSGSVALIGACLVCARS